tara:strand:+ start:873 stop:1523 length:651 start_codon:yes stop_codon:yes gene_type:complete
MKEILFKAFFLSFTTLSCQNNTKEFKQVNSIAIEVSKEDGFSKAYFASGCFWCVEAIFESVYGVHEVISGYSGGFTKNPTYELSNTGRTGHAEAVEVYYDDKIISYSTLLDVYFGSQNISQINGQGPDIGSQYRSIIFYQNNLQRDLIYNKIKEIEKFNNVSVAAEVYPFQKFWKAENYHQNYERLHPNNPYVRNISIPRLKKFQRKFPHLLKINH